MRPEAVEESCEVTGLCGDVEERKGANSDQLGPPRLDLLNSGRQRDRVAMMRSLAACLRVEAVRV